MPRCAGGQPEQRPQAVPRLQRDRQPGVRSVPQRRATGEGTVRHRHRQARRRPGEARHLQRLPRAALVPALRTGVRREAGPVRADSISVPVPDLAGQAGRLLGGGGGRVEPRGLLPLGPDISMRPGAARWLAIVVGLLTALAAPASAAALDGGDGKWVPGSVLVKFGTSNRSKITTFVASAMDGTVLRHLPLIPHAYELRVQSNVTTSIAHAVTESNDLGQKGPRLEWVQPNYYLHLNYFATPDQSAYYPNDPLFWPYAGSNPDNCSGKQAALGQAGLWPWYGDLANSLGPWGKAKANPLPSSQRLPDTSQYNVGLSGAASSSID